MKNPIKIQLEKDGSNYVFQNNRRLYLCDKVASLLGATGHAPTLRISTTPKRGYLAVGIDRRGTTKWNIPSQPDITQTHINYFSFNESVLDGFLAAQLPSLEDSNKFEVYVRFTK